MPLVHDPIRSNGFSGVDDTAGVTLEDRRVVVLFLPTLPDKQKQI